MSIVTPLITKLKDNGTFVTFQSTAEDLTFTFNNNTKRMRFSKFALLDIPDIVTPANGANTIQFKNIESVFVDGLSQDTPAPEGDRTDFSESLQNYMLNLEASILNETSYNPNTNLNVSERVFFKWLKEIGALRFQEAGDSEKASTVGTSRFLEEDDNDDSGSGDLYSRVVRYIGDIDIEGAHKDSDNSFKELYIMVPTNHGNTPTIMFRSFADTNYGPAKTIVGNSDDPEYIIGRDSDDDPASTGLTVAAQYDIDVAYNSLNYEVGGSEGSWFTSILGGQNIQNRYFTDPAFGDPVTDTIDRDDGGGNTLTYKRSRLDGIMIDFDISNYRHFENNSSLTNIGEYNVDGSDFEFNAVLVYYDVWDVTEPDDISTNLYGVLFLDNLETLSVSGSKIKTFNKIKPNNALRKQGNSYGIRMNFRFDVTADNVDQQVEVNVNDYNTFSMLLFGDAMQYLSMSRLDIERIIATNNDLVTRLDALEQLVINNVDKAGIINDIDYIKTQLLGVTPNNQLLELIKDLDTRTKAIESGNTDVDVNVVFDLVPRDGIYINQDGPVVTIGNNNQKYSAVSKVNLAVDLSQSNLITNVVKLKAGSNIVYHDNGGFTKDAEAALFLYIDDAVGWSINQSLKLVFKDKINFNGNGVVIYTDSKGLVGNGQYEVLVGTMATIPDGTTSIEIVCINQTNLDFLIF